MEGSKPGSPAATAAVTYIAKETLSRMARAKMQPVPSNYCRVYREVVGEDRPWASLCQQTQLLEEVIGRLLAPWLRSEALDSSEIADKAKELRQQIRQVARDADNIKMRSTAEALGTRIHGQFAAAEDIQSGLVGVINLIAGNLADLAGDDQWLPGQMQALEALLQEGATAANIDKAKTHLRNVIHKQRAVRRSLTDAQQTLKHVMAQMVEQAGALAENTSEYETKLTSLAGHVQAANDPVSMKAVVGELGELIHEVGLSVRHSRETLGNSHAQLVQAEQQVSELRQKLADTSERARRDALTGAMNRTGLDEIWQREIAQALTNGTPLSLGILDIDNFKRLNDTYGHKIGDDALMHLVIVVQDALRGLDTVARFGGEEFVILLPDTDADAADAVMQRLQRELTKRFFLHNNERILITFSAGVTRVLPDQDTLRSALARADSALYEAKRSGKNRVCMA